MILGYSRDQVFAMLVATVVFTCLFAHGAQAVTVVVGPGEGLTKVLGALPDKAKSTSLGEVTDWEVRVEAEDGYEHVSGAASVTASPQSLIGTDKLAWKNSGITDSKPVVTFKAIIEAATPGGVHKAVFKGKLVPEEVEGEGGGRRRGRRIPLGGHRPRHSHR